VTKVVFGYQLKTMFLTVGGVTTVIITSTVETEVVSEDRFFELFTFLIVALVLSVSSVRFFATEWTVIRHCILLLVGRIYKVYDLD
jgi:hypothetical protein